MLALEHFNAEQFKAEYWQRKPGIFRQVLPGFTDPLSADELAGLALEPGVDSRIIQNDRGKWKLNHGPFEAYEELGDSHWTLLVQAVNEHFPPARALLNAFRFLPDWRIDDLMVSFATPKGGVGPHLDQYDVFIIQGEGKRRWRIGLPGDFKTLTPHPELKQIPAFDAIIDEVLEPGDMIYIPANHPHEGISLEPSLNYSVGFRAPSQAELISAWADHAIDQNKFEQRFRDTQASLAASPEHVSWHLPAAAVTEFQHLMQQALANCNDMQAFLASFLSTNPRPPLPLWPEHEISEENLFAWLATCDTLGFVPGVRWLTIEEEHKHWLYLQGERFAYSAKLEELLTLLREQEWVSAEELQFFCEQCTATTALVVWASNEGLLVDSEEVDEEEED
ncbi:cupin domain-containing protein [Aliidiomarina celeris]|uniref:cupin domain-containing protein n=1 Tax=Aliidiomarina celeris TaxID=2249428 RepID=UPI000DE9C6B8|nr:cupin domain-containing protein [Aliidiomarina celeris]